MSRMQAEVRVNVLLRLVLMLVCCVVTFYFVYWVGAVLAPSSLSPVTRDAIPLFVGVGSAIAVGVFIWRFNGESHPGLAGYVLQGACIVGAIGFIAGFFGPMLFAPGANQGPLLGLFITGPLGFLSGAVGGAVYGLTRTRPPRRPNRPA